LWKLGLLTLIYCGDRLYKPHIGVFEPSSVSNEGWQTSPSLARGLSTISSVWAVAALLHGLCVGVVARVRTRAWLHKCCMLKFRESEQDRCIELFQIQISILGEHFDGRTNGKNFQKVQEQFWKKKITRTILNYRQEYGDHIITIFYPDKMMD